MQCTLSTGYFYKLRFLGVQENKRIFEVIILQFDKIVHQASLHKRDKQPKNDFPYIKTWTKNKKTIK